MASIPLLRANQQEMLELCAGAQQRHDTTIGEPIKPTLVIRFKQIECSISAVVCHSGKSEVTL
jgi:hypothetical protein